ncbi:MAG: GxxExxY protein [Planctomycetota bacterium]
MNENDIGTIIVDCAVKIHRVLGPGLMESVYEAVMEKELERQGLAVQRQVPITIRYENQIFEEGFRADLIVNQLVLIELKSLEAVHPVHKKQLLTYLKLTGLKLGYLLNFGADLMKDGITRLINGYI